MVGKIRVAMIGAGGMANAVHYPSLASFEDVEIAAICELDADRLHATAERYGITGRYHCRTLGDYREAIKAVSPDAVYAIGQPTSCTPCGSGVSRTAGTCT